MTESNTKKPAFLAYDSTRWGLEETATQLGIGFSHKDGQGYDLLLDAIPLNGILSLRTPDASPDSVAKPSGGVPAKRPDYLAYVVSDRKDKEGKARWRLIGYAYHQADGAGLDVIYRTIPLSNRIALRTNKQS